MFETDSCINFLQKLKRLFIASGIRHFLLILVYFVYLFTFAAILRHVEKPTILLNHRRKLHQAALQRHRFVTHEIFPRIFNTTEFLLFIHGDKTRKLSSILHSSLANYERLRCAMSPENSNLSPSTIHQWILFAFTSTTTLGHTNFVIQSTKGKILTLVFSLVGIQLTLLVIGDLAFVLKKLVLQQQKIWSIVIGWILRCVLSKRSKNNRLNQSNLKANSSELSLTLLLFLQIFWLFVGSLLLAEFNHEIPTIDLVINCVNALTTTELGQLTRNGNSLFTILLIFYLLVGFAIMSLIFNSLNLKICILQLQKIQPIKLPKKGLVDENEDEDRRGLMCRNETFEEWAEENAFDESLIQSYHTIGIFQIENQSKRTIESQEIATQTDPEYYSTFCPQIDKNLNPLYSKIPHRYSFSGRLSHDEIQSLVYETYRPKSTVK